MSEIIDKTYKLLDTLDNSDLIKNLIEYKNKLLKNNHLLEEIKKTQKETDNRIIIPKRKAIYDNYDYKMYMKYYQELSFIILKINNQYSKYTKEHTCHE